jgi:hypothetical protein
MFLVECFAVGVFMFLVVKVCHGILTGRWFFPGPPVSSTNKTDTHDIVEILLKVALKPPNKQTN